MVTPENFHTARDAELLAQKYSIDQLRTMWDAADPTGVYENYNQGTLAEAIDLRVKGDSAIQPVVQENNQGKSVGKRIGMARRSQRPGIYSPIDGSSAMAIPGRLGVIRAGSKR